MSLEVSMNFDMLIGTTGNQLSSLVMVRNGSFGKGEWIPEFGAVVFPLVLTERLWRHIYCIAVGICCYLVDISTAHLYKFLVYPWRSFYCAPKVVSI